MRYITTFPNPVELQKALIRLNELSISYDEIKPDPAYSEVGTGAIILSEEDQYRFTAQENNFLCAGWVTYNEYGNNIPDSEPKIFTEDIVGKISVISIEPCVAEPRKLRIVAKISKDITDVLPYVNSQMPQGMFVSETSNFSYMEGYHMITLYPHKITIAKTDDMIDTWYMLEKIRCRLNEIWGRRAEITPNYTMRKKPSAIEVYKKLPGTNCGRCGEKACMAFALKLLQGEVKPAACEPLFTGEFTRLKPPFLDICNSIGLKVEE